MLMSPTASHHNDPFKPRWAESARRRVGALGAEQAGDKLGSLNESLSMVHREARSTFVGDIVVV